jgi:hypothetical protein
MGCITGNGKRKAPEIITDKTEVKCLGDMKVRIDEGKRRNN